MICPKCGSEVSEGSAFCTKCGAALGEQAIQVVGTDLDAKAWEACRERVRKIMEQ